MSTTFVDTPIKGRCYVRVQILDHSDHHVFQCGHLSKHTMTDGFKRVEVCGHCRNRLLRDNKIWKTQWRELHLGEEYRVEQEKKRAKS